MAKLHTQTNISVRDAPTFGRCIIAQTSRSPDDRRLAQRRRQEEVMPARRAHEETIDDSL